MSTSLTRAIEAEPAATRRRVDVDAQSLVAGKCSECGAASWPRRAVCARCGAGDIVEITLPTEGVLETWSRCWVPVAGVEPPYLVGLARFDGVPVFLHIRGNPERVTMPAPVRIRIELGASPPFWAEL